MTILETIVIKTLEIKSKYAPGELNNPKFIIYCTSDIHDKIAEELSSYTDAVTIDLKEPLKTPFAYLDMQGLSYTIVIKDIESLNGNNLLVVLDLDLYGTIDCLIQDAKAKTMESYIDAKMRALNCLLEIAKENFNKE